MTTATTSSTNGKLCFELGRVCLQSRKDNRAEAHFVVVAAGVCMPEPTKPSTLLLWWLVVRTRTQPARLSGGPPHLVQAAAAVENSSIIRSYHLLFHKPCR